MNTSRRSLLGAALALPVSLSALAACSSPTAPEAAPTSSGPWTYTDDTGREFSLEQRPQRVVAFTDYALGLMSLKIKPVGVFGRYPVATDQRFDQYGLDGVEILGDAYGEVNAEKLAELAPDLIVTGIYPTDRKGTLNTEGPYYAFTDVAQQKQLEKIAPIAAIKIGGNGADVIQSINTLAVALGAAQADVDAAKATYDTAAARLTAAARSGLEVTQMYADKDGIYVVKPADEPQTALCRSLGVTYTDLRPDGDYYWDIYSWENASTMLTGDVLLVNNEGYQKADLEKQPTFAKSKALQAGQVHTVSVNPFDYASQAVYLDSFAEILEKSTKV